MRARSPHWLALQPHSAWFADLVLSRDASIWDPSVSSPRRSRYRYPVNCYSKAGGISSYGDMLAIAWIQALSGCISVCGGRLSDRESGLVN